MSYVINKNTLALIPNGRFTKIMEKDNTFIIPNFIISLIDNNCQINGSNLKGRQKGSAYLLGTYYKPPIILNEIDYLILIPTHSERNNKCIWLNLYNIQKYYPKNSTTIVIFNNQKSLELNLSFSKFEKQLLKATRLESILRGRNHQKNL